MVNKSLEELIEGYLGNSLTREELAHFIELIQQDKIEPELRAIVDQLLLSPSFSVPVKEERGHSIFSNIMDAARAEAGNNTGKVIQLRWNRWSNKRFRFAAVAAAIIVVLVAGGAYYWNRPSGSIAKTAPAKSTPATAKTIIPGSNKAVLSLADGSQITLDDEKNGELTRQGSSKVIKINGKLEYSPASMNISSQDLLYNTISTPRGGQYQVELADGTTVWLNAASSLRFPTTFPGKERRVEITGEAYLEVAQNKEKPFIVTANGSEIQVLGTHFNVMAYADEKELTTTLLEGSVKFVSPTKSSILVPGQQSRLSRNGQLSLVNDVDVNAVVAWKNGFFHFENQDIGTVMKQLSRWYDVELVYEDKDDPDQHKKMGDLLHADIPRNTKLSDVLKALEIAGASRFEVEGRKVIIK